MANVVTVKEVCQHLKLTESTVYKLASQGVLPGLKIGKSWRFDMDEILESIRTSNRREKKRMSQSNKAV
jgi:excisionase family DNA binding protein